MVSGLAASETAGCSVFQWADTATIALGFGTCLPSVARKARAGRSCSRNSMGEPWDTKTVGIDIASILTQHMQSAKERITHARLAQIRGTLSRHMGAVGRAGHGSNDAPAGGTLRPQGARPDLDDSVHLPQPRLHDLRRAVCQGRPRRYPAADGRQIPEFTRQAHLDLHVALRAGVARR